MSTTQYITRFTRPSVDDFCRLRSLVGWGPTDREMADISLEHSLFHVGYYRSEHLIAMGRVVGDGAMYFYVQDVVVQPEYQGLGLGVKLMEHIETYLSKVACKGSTAALLSAARKEPFYQRFGYASRPCNGFGAGMCKFL